MDFEFRGSLSLDDEIRFLRLISSSGRAGLVGRRLFYSLLCAIHVEIFVGFDDRILWSARGGDDEAAIHEHHEPRDSYYTCHYRAATPAVATLSYRNRPAELTYTVISNQHQ